jgi:deazaflavin-dependent oxidoreductase (nitroreductase family)
VLVETRGARTRRSHVVALVAVEDPQKPGRIGLIASNFGRGHDPDWCRNLRRWPEAWVLGEGEPRRYTASEVTGDEYERWFDLGARLHPGYPGYRERAGRHIPIFELTPADQG